MLGLLFYGNQLFAQATNLNGYNLQLFRPTIDGKGIVNVAGSDVLNHLQPHLGYYMNVSRGLLSAGNPVSRQTVEIVDTFLTGDFVFGLGLWNFLDFGVDVPVFFFERGRDFNNARIFDTSGVGDIRFDLKFRLLKDGPKRFGIAFLSSLYFPSGETSKFTGYKNCAYEGRLIVDKRFEWLYLAANAGLRAVSGQTVVNINYDDELTFGAGFAVPLPFRKRSFEIFGEINGSAVLKNPSEVTTPLEALGGLRKKFLNDLTLVVGAGGGLTNGAGSPGYRVFSGLAYTFGKKVKSEHRQIRETIYFGFDDYHVAPKYTEGLDRVAEELKEKDGAKVLISGYTDNTGPAAYNMELSKKRALSVKDYLIQKGVDVINMIVRFFGEEDPAASNKTSEGRAENRRAEVDVW